MYYVIIVFLLVVPVLLAVHVWQQRQSAMVSSFLTLLLSLMILNIGFAFEVLFAQTLDVLILSSQFQYIGFTMLPIAWLFFMVRVSRHPAWLGKPSYLLLIGVVPVITLILALFSEQHTLIWDDHIITSDQGFFFHVPTHGSWYWVYMVYAYGVFILGGWLTWWMNQQENAGYRDIYWVSFAISMPLLGAIVEQLGISPFAGVTTQMIGVNLLVIVLWFGFVRWHMVNVAVPSYEFILNSLPDPMVVIDHEDRILGSNLSFVELVTHQDVLIGKFLVKVLPWLLTENTLHQAHSQVQVDDTHWDIQVQPIEKNQGRLLVLRNITEQKRLSDALLAQEQQHFEEITALKEEFVQTVSHDLKNPIGVVMGYSELLLDSEPRPSKDDRHMLRQMLNTSKQMNRLIHNLLDLSKIEAGIEFEWKVVDLKSFIKPVIKKYRLSAAKKQVRFYGYLPDKPIQLRVDEERLKQILENVLLNAVQYTAPLELVTLTVTCEADTINFVIQDSGLGIPEEDLPHLYERFYRVNKSAYRLVRGAGLGLTLTKLLVEQFDGTIEIDSEVKLGTTVTVSLPIVVPQHQVI